MEKREREGRQRGGGEGEGREGDRDESKPPPDVKPGRLQPASLKAAAHRDAPLSGMTSSQSDAGNSCNSFYSSLDSKAAPESGNKTKCIYF